jgi:hypothetical protein
MMDSPGLGWIVFEAEYLAGTSDLNSEPSVPVPRPKITETSGDRHGKNLSWMVANMVGDLLKMEIELDFVLPK